VENRISFYIHGLSDHGNPSALPLAVSFQPDILDRSLYLFESMIWHRSFWKLIPEQVVVQVV